MIYTEMQRLQTVIGTMSYYKKIYIGSDFTQLELNQKNYPMAILKAGTGDVSGYIHGRMQLHIIGLFYKISGIEELVLNQMEAMIIKLTAQPALNPESLSFVLDSQVFDIFGMSVPVTAPYGAFRLTYKIHHPIEVAS